jgi:hypothetical protein
MKRRPRGLRFLFLCGHAQLSAFRFDPVPDRMGRCIRSEWRSHFQSLQACSGFNWQAGADGKRMFATLNSEAMLFVCSVGGLAFFWWLLGKFDASDDANAFTGRTAWWASLITGP